MAISQLPDCQKLNSLSHSWPGYGETGTHTELLREMATSGAEAEKVHKGRTIL